MSLKTALQGLSVLFVALLACVAPALADIPAPDTWQSPTPRPSPSVVPRPSPTTRARPKASPTPGPRAEAPWNIHRADVPAPLTSTERLRELAPAAGGIFLLAAGSFWFLRRLRQAESSRRRNR